MASPLTSSMPYRAKYQSTYTPAVAYASDCRSHAARPLPAGPGPLDSQGRRCDYRPLRTLLRSESPPRRAQPIRVQQPAAAIPVSKRYSPPSTRYTATSPGYGGRAVTLPRGASYVGRPREVAAGPGGKYGAGTTAGVSSRYRSCSPGDGRVRLGRRDHTLSHTDLSRLRITEPYVDRTPPRVDRTPPHVEPPRVELARSERRYSSTRDLSRPDLTPPAHTPHDNLPDITPPRRKSLDRWEANANGNGNTTKHYGLDGGSVHPTTELLEPSTSSVDEPRRRAADVSRRHGQVGLRNLGNTCFMNSILQCLSNTKPLLELCLDPEQGFNTANGQKGVIVSAYVKLMKSLWTTSDASVSPTDFKCQISKFAPRFGGYNQQDAHEFLIYLLEGLHKDLNQCAKKKRIISVVGEEEEDRKSDSQKAKEAWKRYLEFDNSKIVNTFVGQLRSSLRCEICGYVSNTFDPFWDLSLPIRKDRHSNPVQLSHCFDLFTQEEVLDGDEKPTCAKCKKRQKCTKSFAIQKFPMVLVIHLKRFNEGSFYRSKLSTEVDFPIRDLDLTSYAADKHCPQVVYNLYAISNHSGSTYGGHYTAYAKHPRTSDWHFFNDQRVSSSSESSMQSSEAYLLFYELTHLHHH